MGDLLQMPCAWASEIVRANDSQENYIFYKHVEADKKNNEKKKRNIYQPKLAVGKKLWKAACWKYVCELWKSWKISWSWCTNAKHIEFDVISMVGKKETEAVNEKEK